MSYPPPRQPGEANPYEQQPYQGAPPQGGWGLAPPPPPMPSGGPAFGAQPGFAAAATSPPPTKRRFGCLGMVLAFCGLVGVLAGSGVAWNMYSNHQQVVGNEYDFGPVMWRNEPADTIFPNTLGLRLDDDSTPTTDAQRAPWRRVGISPETACEKGLGRETFEKVEPLGCTAVLRATYVDPTGSAVATVALIVLHPNNDDVHELEDSFSEKTDKEETPAKVRTFAVPHTAAEKWNDAFRNGAAAGMASSVQLPYGVAATTGTTDGRKIGQLPGRWAAGDADDLKDQRVYWDKAAQNLVDVFQDRMVKLLKGQVKA